MVVNINVKEHFYNDNVAQLDDKWNQKIKIWYYIFIGINVLNLLLYINRVHPFHGLLIGLPFFHIFLTYIFWIVRAAKKNPNGDRQYIERYYPEVAKKLKFEERNSIGWMEFLAGEYIDFNKDIIIDNIRERTDENRSLMIRPFIICISFWIISFIAIIVVE